MAEHRNPEDLMEFPCRYQFKAVGVSDESFKDGIIAAVSCHADVLPEAVHSRPSGKGSYQAVSIDVTLADYQQLVRIYAEMRQVNGLKMLL